MTGKHTNPSDPTNTLGIPLTADTPSTEPTPEADLPATKPEAEAGSTAMSVLSEHKGKLAIGVAATLGAMIYYGWRQKQLPKEDPEAYARLQRIKDSMKANASGKQAAREKQRTAAQPDKKDGKS